MKYFYIVFLGFLGSQLSAQLFVPVTGVNNYTVCSGTLYDSGGQFGNYSDNSNGYTVLTPSTAGNMVQIGGTLIGENCCDFMQIFNGSGLGGNLLWSGNTSVGAVPTITSTTGPLTVQFITNGNVVGAGFALDIICVPPATLTVPETGVNSYTVCSGTLYDSGGPSGSYANNSNGYTILNPSNPGYMIRVNGSSIGENVFDVIQIYNGAGLTGNLLWEGSLGFGSIPTITSTAGPLTVKFTSNASTTGNGFALDINCDPPATFTVPVSGVNNYTVCSGTLYDSGGPFGNYSDNSNGYTVLNPSNPGNMVQIGGSFNGQNCCDFLQIFNGVGLTGNLLWSGIASIDGVPTITSTAGPLTVQFISNGNTVGAGFALDINCVPPATLTVPVTGVNTYTVCSGTLYDSGGPSGSYANNSDGYTILNPSNPGYMMSVSGSSIGENVFDVIQIYNGAGLTGNLLWEGSPGLGSIPTITSTTGPLTVKFTSNASTTGNGFALNLICTPPTTFTVPTSGVNNYTVCSGVLYDSGGPLGNYSDDSNGYTTLYPSNPGNMVQIGGTFTGQNCCDFMQIFNGVGLGGNLLWSGNPSVGVVPTITSTSGPLTVQFISNGSVVGAGFALDIICLPPIIFTVPSSGNNEYTVCSGILYDSGGPTGSYVNNSNGYTILNPSNPGYMMTVSGGSLGESAFDVIQIYNGAGLTGNLLWEGSPGLGSIPTITSTAGPLTVKFTSNASTTGNGFALDLICTPPTTFTVPTSGVNNYTVCSGVLYDSGGPFGNYSDDSNGYTTLYPSNPGNMVQIGGTFTGQNCCDFMQIFNGVGLGGNLLWSGNSSVGSVPTITSTAGPLTVQFISNGSIVGAGFALDIDCVPPATFTVPASGNNEYTVCSGILYDSGGPTGSYVNNSNGYTILNPSNPGYMMTVSGGSLGESAFDVIQIYNGAGLTGNLLWEGSPGLGSIPTITSTAGPLTVKFTSNASTTGNGFALDLICTPPTTFTVPTSGVNNYTVCSGTLYDSGGPFGNYSDDSNGYTVLNPSNPGSLMQIGGSFNGQNCCDFLNIFNGVGLGGNLLWSGNASAGVVPTITSTSGPLTVQFISNGSIVGAGFALDINCVQSSSCTPTISITSSQGTSICVGQEVVYSTSITNGGLNPSYQWKRNGSNVSTSATYTSSANINGDIITCILTSNASCAVSPVVTSNSLNMIVSATAMPSFTQVPAICSGSTLSPLPSTSNNGISGTWLPAMNNTATTTYTFTPDANQCGTTTTMTIVVNPNTTPSFLPVGPFCAGQTITPLPTTSLNGISGSWSPALNNTITTNYTFTPSVGQCAATTNTIIVINENPTVTLTFDGAILTASAGFTGYVWTLNGSTLTDATTNELMVAQVGLYAVTVTDANGCNASASFEVQTVGLANPSFGNEFSLHPNPSLGITTLTLLCTEKQTAHIRVLDLQGKIQFQQTYSFNVGKNEVPLNFSNLADGVYFLQLENSNFKHTKRLVKLEN
ncbi:MAG TPA: T9SS type A sorting domain-containing protein [Flavobacteriales bacterium]|nr:T9SS type A sorting domain-containing protein [Flavobacteriales bacterium]